MYAKFSEMWTFLTLWYARNKCSLFVNFAYVLNAWFLILFHDVLLLARSMTDILALFPMGVKTMKGLKMMAEHLSGLHFPYAPSGKT